MHYTKYSLVMLFILLLTSSAYAEFIESSVNSADGVPISYRVQGEGAPTLVFIHGWLGNQSFWDAQREFFAQKYQVITLDLAGHGKSGQERQEWTMEHFGDDVVAVLDALDVQKAILIGHAMGGSAALEAAQKLSEQVIGIVGVDTMQNFELSATLEQQEHLLSRFRTDYTGLTTRIAHGMFSPGGDPAIVEKIVREMLSVPEEIGLQALQASMGYIMLPAVEALTIPLRAINSDASPTNLEANRRHIQSYEFVLVPGSKHLFFLESPDEFNQILGNVLQELIEHNAKKVDAIATE